MKKSVIISAFVICADGIGCQTLSDNILDKSALFVPAYEGVWNSPPKHTPNGKVPDGAINGNGDIGFVLGGDAEESVFYLSKNDFWKAKNGYPDGGVCYVGQLYIKASDMKDAIYEVRQSISEGVVKTRYTRNDGSSLCMKAWCAATKNIVVIELEAIKGRVDLSYSFSLAEGMNSQNSSGEDKGVSWFTRKFEGEDLEWSSAVSVAISSTEGKAANLSLEAGKKTTLLLSLCSNHDKSDYIQEAVNMTAGFKKEGTSGLFEKHKEWWTNFWQASKVELNDSLLEKYYYGSHYLLACCSRDKDFAPGLWGTSLTMDATANGWAGDYHTNYNYMAPWWGVYSSNHVELSEPYDQPILDYMPKAREHAKSLLDNDGVYYPVGIGPKGFCSSMFPLTHEAMMNQYGTPDNDIEGGYMFLGQKSNAAFCATNMFMRFYHTYDRNYAQMVYPFIREVADFWEDYLVFENDRYVIYNDNFWEVGPWEGKDYKRNYGDINPTISLGLCRMLFKGIIDMSSFLQTDQDKVEKWNHILSHLSAIPTVELDGKIRIKACEGGNGSGSRTAPGFGRVMMHGLLFPSGTCGVITDSVFARILREEIYRWDTDTIPYSGPRDAHWDNLGNGIETYFTSAARVGYDGGRLLDELKERIKKTALPNLWIPQDGGGIESFSAVPSCINEMLLQGYEGVIRVFPVWPKEMEASFKTLRTHGAFLVSASCKAGNVEYVLIKSEQGRPCNIQNPWPGKTCYVYYEDGRILTFNDNFFKIPLSKGEQVRITRM